MCSVVLVSFDAVALVRRIDVVLVPSTEAVLVRGIDVCVAPHRAGGV